MKTSRNLLLALSLLSTLAAADPGPLPDAKPAPAGPPPLLIHELHYLGTLTDDEARFTLDLDLEVLAPTGASQPVLEGEVALLPSSLPAGLRVERRGNEYWLAVSKRGRHRVKLEFVVLITRAEPWNQVSFLGPSAAIAGIEARAPGTNVELQLLTGTTLETSQTNNLARLRGFLGAAPTVALRWSQAGGPAMVARRAVVTVDTSVAAQLTPTVVKQVLELRYEVLQGKLPGLRFRLPRAVALTRLVGDQIRDWEVKSSDDAGNPREAGSQELTVEFIKPADKQCQVTLYCEQPLEGIPSVLNLAFPEPLDVERESGSLAISAEDIHAEVVSAAGLRQVNAPAGAFAAYRFAGRLLKLELNLRRIEPVIHVADRLTARLEEARCVVKHALSLEIEKAGVYALDLACPAGWTPADVRGEGVEDWNSTEGPAGARRLRVNIATRVLGARNLDVQLEQAFKTFPEQLTLEPLRVAAAARERAWIGAGSTAGIRLKTAEVSGLREIPVGQLPDRADELLAYQAEQPDWKLMLAAERLAPRILAEVFHLVTIGDGIVGGSATIRYGLINQGVQEFQLRLPPAWKNVEFTGPGIRRKEPGADGLWTIGLQDKAWGGYTLVVTYDFQFDPQGATLPVGGLRTLGVERETGSIALTTAAGLKVHAPPLAGPLRRVDETELAPADRALVTRAILLAYQYSDAAYNLAVEVQRFDPLPVLSAVADRTQLTTVFTESGEMLTQGTFMVKNNDKQFQRFQLPPGAALWSCHVNGQAVKAERDGDWLLVPLPRGTDRDQALAVDIVYAEKKAVAASLFSPPLSLAAPRTDVPNTYAEWHLYCPPSLRLSGFRGNMAVAPGTTYDLGDAWNRCVTFYRDVLRHAGNGLFLMAALVVLLVALIASAARRGWNGVFAVLGVAGILALLGAMTLPALSRAKARAQRISAVNNLKQIGLALRTFALDNNDRLPASYEEMANELGADQVTLDPETGERFVYLGAGLNLNQIKSNSILAHSPRDVGGHRAVLLADGSVQQIRSEVFAQLARQGLIQPASPDETASNQQVAAVQRSQLPQAGPLSPAVDAQPAPGVSAQAPVGAAPGRAARAIRIELPRSGQAVTFTKVLNLHEEPLALSVRVMRLHTFQMTQMGLQLSTFIAGLLLALWQWRRPRRNSFILTLALALVLGSVGHLLLDWRLLHAAWIVLAPALALSFIAWLTWRFWPRKTPETGPAPAFEPGLPPAVAALALLLGAPAATAADSPAPPTVVIQSATYSGTVNDCVARLDVTFHLTASRDDQKLALFGDEVVVQDFTARPASVRLLREGNRVAALLSRKGQAMLQLKLLVPLQGDVTRRQLAFAVPPALTSQLELSLDQPDADIEFPTAISFKRAPAGPQTTVRAVLGAAERVELHWTPRVKRAAEIAANVVCHHVALARVGAGALNVRSVLDYQVTQGELRQTRIVLPPGHRLLRLTGDAIRTWEVRAEDPGQVLTIELLKGIPSACRFTLETEAPFQPPPASVSIELPRALDVKRQTGLLGLQAEEDLELIVERAEPLARVDAEEFARAAGAPVEGRLNAFRFLNPAFGLQTRVSPIQPQLEAVVRHQVRVGPDQLLLSALLDYKIKRTGVFTLKIGLPPHYRLESVAGDKILQWVEREQAGARLLEITFTERVANACSLRLELSRHLTQLPRSLPIEGVYPLATAKLTGFIAVAAEPGVALQTEALDKLTEIPATAIPGSAAPASGILAYKFLSEDASHAPEWNLTVATETVESWVRAEIVNLLHVSETLVSGRALARFEIQNAPVKELRLRIPAAFRNVEISHPNLRRRDRDGEVWKVEFQNKLGGVQILTVTWDAPPELSAQSPDAGSTSTPAPPQAQRLKLRGIAAEGVERETGFLAILARPPLQIAESETSGLQAVDVADLPAWAGQPDPALVSAYRYLRPAWSLAILATRFDEAEVLQTLVEQATLTTVVADDGQMMTELSLSVRNHGRQHLEVALPAGATVWSAFVAGQAVKPCLREGRVLLPLEQSPGADAPLALQLVYVATNRFPRTRGSLELASPALDVPLRSARWEVFLPADYRYANFGGTMSRETAAPESANFSLLDYSYKEVEGKAGRVKELKSDLSSARRQLAYGNVKEAYLEYNRARAKGGFANGLDADARQLEEQLRRAQGSNLINAQNAFTLNNTGPLPGQQQFLAAQPPAQVRYDAAAAEAQWTRLQQAQEVVVARVQPIRINLPTRGLRHTFTQMLQTQPGKSMTITSRPSTREPPVGPPALPRRPPPSPPSGCWSRLSAAAAPAPPPRSRPAFGHKARLRPKSSPGPQP